MVLVDLFETCDVFSQKQCQLGSRMLLVQHSFCYVMSAVGCGGLA